MAIVVFESTSKRPCCVVVRICVLAVMASLARAYDCTPLAVYDGAMGRIAEGPDCCNDYYRGCTCPEGTCCDYATGKCFPRVDDMIEQCASGLYDYQKRYFTMSFHGSCTNSCPCLCNCNTQAECDECDCPMEDTNPCVPFCFGCNTDNMIDNCRVCGDDQMAAPGDFGYGGKNDQVRV